MKMRWLMMMFGTGYALMGFLIHFEIQRPLDAVDMALAASICFAASAFEFYSPTERRKQL